MVKKSRNNIFLWVLIFLPYLLVIGGVFYYFKKVNEISNSSFIIINKEDMTLSLYDYKGNLLQKSGVATGKSFGNKKSIGDLKTPEGVFRIIDIQDASNWSHDFKDDTLGDIKGAYGPYFIRLDVLGQKGIGIHGTHDGNSIGTRASEGCIRMNNKEVSVLANRIKPSTVVVIIPGIQDVKANFTDTTKFSNKIKSNLDSVKKVKISRDIDSKKILKFKLKKSSKNHQ